MLPGMGGGNPRQMARMMRQMGIDMKEIKATNVIIELEGERLVFGPTTVSLMRAQGQDTYSISSKPTREKVSDGGATSAPAPAPAAAEPAAEANPLAGTEDVELEASADDIAMVVEQTGCTPEAAKEALAKAGGDLAEAIVALSS